VRRGVAAPSPSKYVLDEKELQRIARIARIELQDARVELKRARKAAEGMGQEFKGDDMDEDDEEGWVEWVGFFFSFSLACFHVLRRNGRPSEEEDVDMEEGLTHKASKNDEDELAKYKLDEYDNDEEEEGMSSFVSLISIAKCARFSAWPFQ
jgi:periodic tryptophan protein 1